MLQLKLTNHDQPKSVWVATTHSSIKRWSLPKESLIYTQNDDSIELTTCVEEPEVVVPGQLWTFFILIRLLD